MFTLFLILCSTTEFQFSSYLHYELLLLCSNQIWAVFIGDQSWRCFHLIYCRIWSFGCFGTYLSEREGADFISRSNDLRRFLVWHCWSIELCSLLNNFFAIKFSSFGQKANLYCLQLYCSFDMRSCDVGFNWQKWLFML